MDDLLSSDGGKQLVAGEMVTGPREWHYNQIIELTDDLGSTTIDHVVVSRRAQS